MTHSDNDEYILPGISLRPLLAGVFLTSFCLLSFEIALTRLLSVLYSYHFVFGVISYALMGHGLGAVYVLLRKNRQTDAVPLVERLSFCTGICAFTIALSALAVIRLGHSANGLLFFLVILFLPFFFGGVFFAEVFRAFSACSFWVYSVDLVGAGIGCAAIIFLLELSKGSQAVFIIALFIHAGGLILLLDVNRGTSFEKRKDYLKTGFGSKVFYAFIINGFLLMLLLICSFSVDVLKRIPVGLNPEKEIHLALKEGQVEDSRWSAFGQTDLVGYKNFPERKDLYIDGTAGTPMYRFNGDIGDPDKSVAMLKQDFPGYFPFRFLSEAEKDNALIIGPGGGRDILLALMGGIKEIKAVEVNRDFVNIVQDYSLYNGGIYTSFKNVHITIDEGRSFLKRQKQNYDLIMLSLPATNSSRSREAFALTENFLLTTEAIEDYLAHLTDEGRLLVVTHGEIEALRLLSTTLAALERQGVDTKEAMKRLYLVGDDQYPVFVLQKQPLAPNVISAMYHMHLRLGYAPESSYFPHVDRRGSVNSVLLNLATNRKTIAETINQATLMGYDVNPVSDNSPFFFKFKPGLPRPVKWVLWLSIITLSVVITGASYFAHKKIPRIARHKRLDLKSSAFVFRYSFLFFVLGTGFMVVEVSMTQQCFLFLGQPILSLAVMLFAILTGAGIGGLSSKIVAPEKLQRAIAFSMFSVAIVLFGYTYLLPIVFNALIGSSLIIRMLMTVLLLTVLGFLMGFPFPLALRSLHYRLSDLIPWMIGINGLSSVFGSALSVAVAIKAGIIQALWTGTLLYFVGSCLFFWAKGETNKMKLMI